MKFPAVILTVGLAMGLPGFAYAETASDLNSQVTTMNTTTANQGQTNVINKISGDFNSFLRADSKTAVTGLRSGTPFTLTSTSTTPSTTPGGLPVTTTTNTVITPPTGQSGASDSGIVSGSGKPHGNSGQGIANGKGSSDGIVTASGKGNGNAYGLNRSGIVTGSGSSAAANGGIVGAGGSNGNGAANSK